MLRCQSALLIFALFFLAGSVQGLHAQKNETHPSVHQEQLNHYQSLGYETEAEWDAYHQFQAQPARKTAGPCNLNKKVYGWHPYWMGTAYNNYDWDLLSTFCYFSYEVNPNTGNYNSIHGWKTTNSVNLAQAAGVRVELCATLFGGTNNSTFLTNNTARQRCIDSLIAMVQYRNADGINIDFEGIPGSQRNNFTSFMQDLSTQLKTAVPGASLSMALFAVDWNNVFDIPNLDPYVDEFVIMGYGYYYSGSSTAGPTAPLYAGSRWWAYNLTRTILYYLDEGATPEKLLIGLPWYGNEYQTASNSIPSASNSFVSARTYSYVKNNYQGVQTRVFDEHSQSTAWLYQSGGQWRQAWVDDEEAIREKLKLALQRNIGGIGIWALGYDNGYSQIWDLLRELYSDCGPGYCADTIYDTGGPLGNHRNNEDNQFVVQSPNGEQIQATFLQLDLENNYDSLFIHDGTSTSAPLIGGYSGNVLPGAVSSTGDALTFHFTSDGATVDSGFAIAWQCINGLTYYPTDIYHNRNDSATLDCGLTYHNYYDSDAGTGGNYNNGEANTMTFCVPDSNRVVQLNFRMQTAPVQLDLKSTTNGNDYLYFFDGVDTTANLIGLYTGSTNSYPQPGTVISSGRCLTVKFESDGSSTGSGWEARLRCVSPLAVAAAVQVGLNDTLLYRDSGGAGGNYGNNESSVVTYCPSPAALTAGEVVWASFMDTVAIEQNYDYLHVFDGPDVNSRVISTYTGNDLDQNTLFTIKATEENPSGCLTFQFYSDGATTRAGWEAHMTTGEARLAYGTNACSGATLITRDSTPYAGSTTLATGLPNSEDPPLNISLAALPECSGSNTITRLENTIWYRFSTPSALCSSTQINFQLENVSCQNSIPGGNGAQFVLYEASTCQNGAAWGTPIYCADKLLANSPVNVASLLQPSRTYYIMVDGFAGQACNLDLILTGDVTGCILPIELLSFHGEREGEVVNLYWKTAHEDQNHGFFVERGFESASGKLTFEDLGFVASQTVQGGGADYFFPDPAFARDRVNYYRLRQLDLNGAVHYHRVIRVVPEALDNGPVLTVFPNPAGEVVRFALDRALAADGYLRIFNASGKLVFEQVLKAGTSGEVMEIELGDWAAGMYFYQAGLNGFARSGKFLRRE